MGGLHYSCEVMFTVITTSMVSFEFYKFIWLASINSIGNSGCVLTKHTFYILFCLVCLITLFDAFTINSHEFIWDFTLHIYSRQQNQILGLLCLQNKVITVLHWNEVMLCCLKFKYQQPNLKGFRIVLCI